MITVSLVLLLFYSTTAGPQNWLAAPLIQTGSVTLHDMYGLPAAPSHALPQVVEEVKFEPKVSCKVLDESVTFKQADLLHGDILLVQRALTQVLNDIMYNRCCACCCCCT